MNAPIDLELPAAPAAIAQARAAVDRIPDEAPTMMNNLRLLVSELVTNSIRHADLGEGARILLHIEVEPAVVRVEVTDAGAGFVPHVPSVTIAQDSGWGLYLVEQIADRWGVTQDDGTCVWFELDR